MNSSGSPGKIVDGDWFKDGHINGRPSYRLNAHISCEFHTHCWLIAIDHNVVACSLTSLGAHPLTITNEWTFLLNGSLQEWPAFSFDVTSCALPYMLEDLGDDFFVRVKLYRIVQWIHPHSGQLEHSGAKKLNGTLGRRWCPFCCAAYSANNFQSQHLKIHDSMMDDPDIFSSCFATDASRD